MRSALEAGVPRERVLDELAREVDAAAGPRLGRAAVTRPAGVTNLSSVTTFVVDRSERGKLALTGPDAKTFLHGQVTNDIESLTPGHGCYAAFLTHKGKMLGDLRVFDLGDELLLDCERVVLQELFNMIRRYKLGARRRAAQAHAGAGAVRVIGPDAPPLAGPDEHDSARVTLGGARGARGDHRRRRDLFFAAADRDAVRAALEFPDGDEAAAEVVRVERGRPRYGVDLDDTVIPQEAGLNERAVSFTKGCYVGQETVARLYYRGKPNRRLLGLRLSEPAPTGSGAAAGREGRGAARVVRGLARARTDRARARAPRGGPRRHGRCGRCERHSSSTCRSRGNAGYVLPAGGD